MGSEGIRFMFAKERRGLVYQGMQKHKKEGVCFLCGIHTKFDKKRSRVCAECKAKADRWWRKSVIVKKKGEQ